MYVGFQWNSLSTKIIAWSFVPTAIILMAVALVTLNAYQEVTEDLVIERDREVTRLSAQQLVSELGEYIYELTTQVRTMDLVYDNAEQLQNILLQGQNRLAAFDGGVVVLDSAGAVKASLPHREEIVGQNWSDRAYFREMLRGIARPVYSGVVSDGPAGAEVIVLAVPFIGPQNQFRGMLAGMFRLNSVTGSAFYGSVVSLRTNQSGTLYLVDDRGRVIYHSDNDQIGADFSAQPVVQQVLQGQVNAVRTKDVGGADIVAAFAPVPGTPWGLVSEESWAVLTGDSRGHQKFLLLLLLLGVIVPTLLVFVGVKRIMRPIEHLIDASQSMARGQFGHTIEVRSHDEVGKLAEQFNRMSSELQSSYAHLEQRVADRTRELSALYEVTKVASESLEVQSILERSLGQVLEALNAEVGVIQLLDEGGKTPHIAAHQGISLQEVRTIDRLPPDASFAHWVIQHKEPLVIADIAKDPRTAPVLQPAPPHTYVGVPVRSKQLILGVLSVARQAQRPFSVEDVALLASIADQVGVSIENARLYQAEQRRAEQFRVISEVGRRITSILALDELLVQLTRIIQEAFGFYHVSIGLIEGDEVIYKMGAGPLWTETPGEHFVPDQLRVGKEGITGWVACKGQALLVPDVSKEPRYLPMKRGGDKIRAELAVPIRAKGKVIGVLDIQSDRLNPFDQSDLMVLQSLADQAGITIENARLYEQAEEAAVMQERGRLARDLHDSVTQSLYSVNLFAEAARRLIKQGDLENTKEYLQQLQDNAQQALKELRLLVYELRPSTLEHEGLIRALQHRLSTVEERAGVKAELVVDGTFDLEKAVEEALYRIAQEALNNSLKHAAASAVRVQLRSQVNQLSLEVCDDGRGFDPAQLQGSGGIGMSSMRERIEKLGGSFQITSAPGQGTLVRCQISWTT